MMPASPARQRFASYQAFWPFYLREHARPATRALHYVGTALAVVLLVYGLVGPSWPWALVPISGYGFAWIAHGTIEHNKPATFIHPWWSLISDFRMFGLFVAGRLKPHLERAGVDI